MVANAAAPGFVKTDFIQNATGFVAGLIRLTRVFAVTPAKGAATPLWVASAPELASVNGKFFDARREKDGKFRDQPQLDELERLLDAMTGISRAGA